MAMQWRKNTSSKAVVDNSTSCGFNLYLESMQLNFVLIAYGTTLTISYYKVKKSFGQQRSVRTYCLESLGISVSFTEFYYY